MAARGFGNNGFNFEPIPPTTTTAASFFGTQTSGTNNLTKDSMIPHGPMDTVACLRWSINNWLCSSGWSKEIRIWDINKTNGLATPKFIIKQSAPILSCDWINTGDAVVYGACDGVVRLSTLSSLSLSSSSNADSGVVVVGTHDAPIKSCIWNKTIQTVITGSWDKTVKFFDIRQISSNNKPVTELKQTDKVVAMDNRDHLLAIGLSNKNVVIYDLRNMKTPWREYPKPFLQKQTSGLVLFPDKKSFALSSIEGRVRIQYLEAGDDEKKSFIFRCHKVGEYDAYAVNALAVTDAHDGFVTAGSDGTVVFWEKEQKQKMNQLERMNMPITAAAYNYNGTILAYAAGYDWSQGIKPMTNSSNGTCILLHQIQPAIDLTVKQF